MGPFGNDGFWFASIDGHDIQVPPGYLIYNHGLAREGYDFLLTTHDQWRSYDLIMQRAAHFIGGRTRR